MVDEQGYPIYFVISEIQQSAPFMFQYTIRKMLHCFTCDILDLDAIWKNVVVPLQAHGLRLDTAIFSREPVTFIQENAKPYNPTVDYTSPETWE